MKIKDVAQKKRVTDRLRRVEWQIRGVIQMIQDEEQLRDIVQQLVAIRSAMTQAVYELDTCGLERLLEKKGIDPAELAEFRDLLKILK